MSRNVRLIVLVLCFGLWASLVQKNGELLSFQHSRQSPPQSQSLRKYYSEIS